MGTGGDVTSVILQRAALPDVSIAFDRIPVARRESLLHAGPHTIWGYASLAQPVNARITRIMQRGTRSITRMPSRAKFFAVARGSFRTSA